MTHVVDHCSMQASRSVPSIPIQKHAVTGWLAIPPIHHHYSNSAPQCQCVRGLMSRLQMQQQGAASVPQSIGSVRPLVFACKPVP
ncbi:hypothetical protein BDA96_03G442200 [Sorghum bicolor]|uniref:Uncharacterized protein n=1 Tax=Sorghum bicolor TaxID=4558 RepID=A0A921RJ93_SORBI|nr:hypothetical protein BDA96_03G442200 [Sorghum bicolor]